MPDIAPPTAAPAPSPVVAPVSTPAPATPPRVIPNRDKPTGQFKSGPPAPPTAARPTISARKAFGLAEDPAKTSAAAVKGLRDSFRKDPNNVVIADPVEPTPDPVVAAPPAPVIAAPTAPAAPTKIKIGSKEFTLEELEAQQHEYEALKAAPAPVAPAAPETPAAPAPTAEEIAQKEEEWVTKSSSQMKADLTEQDLETILTGGPEAVKLFSGIRQRDMARAVLSARKGIAEALNPVLENIFNSLQPVLQQHEQVQRYSVTQQFEAKHPDFKPHMDLATKVAESLMERHPAEVGKMSTEQFLDEVARQTDNFLTQNWRRFNPSGSWRDAGKPAAQVVPVVPSPAPIVTPTPLPIPAVRPLSGNAPQALTGQKGSWNKQVAATLVGGKR
jgi:hypothetical protein